MCIIIVDTIIYVLHRNGYQSVGQSVVSTTSQYTLWLEINHVALHYVYPVTVTLFLEYFQLPVCRKSLIGWCQKLLAVIGCRETGNLQVINIVPAPSEIIEIHDCFVYILNYMFLFNFLTYHVIYTETLIRYICLLSALCYSVLYC